MGQKWCPLKLGGHHGLRRLRQEDVLAGRIRRIYPKLRFTEPPPR